jgi:hypothetical protein
MSSISYIRRYYGVPAKIRGCVRYKGRPGTITGTSGPHLLIRLDGEKKSDVYHPTWEIEYERNQIAASAPREEVE